MAVEGYTSSGKPIPQWWVGQINKGKKFREKHAQQKKWDDWRRMYRGEWRGGILPSNIFFKMLRTMVPRIYYRNPSISLTPSKSGAENMLLTKLFERADNKLIDVMDVKGQMKRSVQHGIMFGTGGLRLGYGAEFTPTPDPLGTESPDGGTTRVKNAVEYNDLIHANMPWVLAAHPGHVIVPEGCESIHSARWVCYETYRTVADLKADPRFRYTDKLGDGPSGMAGHLIARGASDRPIQGVMLWEIRDKKTGKVFVMAPSIEHLTTDEKCLFDDDDDLLFNGRLNYYPLIFNADDEVFWGIPDSQIMEPQQYEKNEIRTQMMYHRRVALAKFLYTKGSITPDELSKLIAGDIFAGVQVNDVNDVKAFNPPEMPSALITMEADVDREVQEIMGLGVNQFGEYAPGSADRSATESQIVNQATQIRIDERRDVCADLLVRVVEHLNYVILEHWSGDQVLDVVGPAGVQLWLKFQPHELRSALYDIKIDPDTSLPQTKQLREQRAFAMYNALKPNPLIDPMALTRYLVNEIDGTWTDALIKMANTSPQNPMPVDQAAGLMNGAAAGGNGAQPPGIPPI